MSVFMTCFISVVLIYEIFLVYFCTGKQKEVLHISRNSVVRVFSLSHSR